VVEMFWLYNLWVGSVFLGQAASITSLSIDKT
jgi:hypothetical protein